MFSGYLKPATYGYYTVWLFHFFTKKIVKHCSREKVRALTFYSVTVISANTFKKVSQRAPPVIQITGI